MIYLLEGDNSYEIDRFVGDYKGNFDGQIEIVDGSSDNFNLYTLLFGQTIFSANKLVIIKQLSIDKKAWRELSENLDIIDSSLHLILIEPSVDRRTKAYKDISSVANILNFDSYNSKTHNSLKKWLIEQATQDGLKLNGSLAELLISRVGYNQWALANALERLKLAGELSDTSIIEQTQLSTTDNIFMLLEMAFKGQIDKLLSTLENLKVYEDAYKTLGLISSQLLLIAVIMSASKGQNIQKDFGANPYMLSKLKILASKITFPKIAMATKSLALADEQTKTTTVDPWVCLEQALLKIAVFK